MLYRFDDDPPSHRLLRCAQLAGTGFLMRSRNRRADDVLDVVVVKDPAELNVYEVT